MVEASEIARSVWVRPAARWTYKHVPAGAIEQLQQLTGLSRLVSAVLAARGFGDIAAVQAFLSPDLSQLHAPLGMRDMDRAVARIRRALADREPVLLYGDYDVDGTSSIVVLKKALEILGGKVEFHVPHRLTEGYGMRPEVIARAAAEGVRLVISVDCGIRAAAVVAHANDLGVDVIVTDHHLPDADIPPAWAVLNPNRPGCSYPNKDLCGAGVTLKLVQALLEASGLPAARQSALLDSFLKPVAIATIADIVPLTGENRVIVQRGLSGLKSVRNPGLRSLLRVAGFEDGDCPSAHQVAFRLAPRINAAGRMASARDVVDLFLTDDLDRAKSLAEQLDALNRERQQVESEIVEQIVRECEGYPVERRTAAMVFAGEGWHPGVLGIVASRLVERFSRPVFVLSDAQTGDYGDERHLTGSGRSIAAFHLLDALESMPHFFRKFGGHRQAAGLTMAASNLEAFRDAFATYAGGLLSEQHLRPHFDVDAEAQLSEINDRSVDELMRLGPFGFGNTVPTLAVCGVEVAGPARVIKEGKHFSVPIRQGGRTAVAKAWSFGDRAHLFAPGTKLDVLLQIEDDPYSKARGYSPWCFVMKDARLSEPAVV